MIEIFEGEILIGNVIPVVPSSQLDWFMLLDRQVGRIEDDYRRRSSSISVEGHDNDNDKEDDNNDNNRISDKYFSPTPPSSATVYP